MVNKVYTIKVSVNQESLEEALEALLEDSGRSIDDELVRSILDAIADDSINEKITELLESEQVTEGHIKEKYDYILK